MAGGVWGEEGLRKIEFIYRDEDEVGELEMVVRWLLVNRWAGGG